VKGSPLAAPRPWLIALVALLAGAAAARSALQVTQGLQAEYFFDAQPGGDPAVALVSPDISTAQIAADWNGSPPSAFRARWFGYLAIRRAGEYAFATTSDDGSTVTIDGQLVVDNGGVHGPREAHGRIRLEPGSHFVLVDYSQAGGHAEMRWAWAREGRSLAPVPGWLLSPRRVSYERAAIAALLDRLALTLLAAVALLLAWLTIKHTHGPVWTALQARPRAASLGLFAVLAIVETWPLATDPAHLSRNDNGDTVLNEWTLAWVAHQAPRAPFRLYDANIFYPERDTLAYSESMIVQSAMAAPFLWLGASPVLAYNLVLMAGFALTGWAAALVVARWTGDWIAALISGMLAGFNAHTMSRLPHLQAQHGEFLPLALFALDALLREPRAANALRLAVWFALQGLTSVYLLVFTAFGLAGAAIVRPDAYLGPRARRVAPMVALAAGVAVVALTPFLLPYWRAYRGQGMTRSVADAAQYAANWSDYLTTPARLHGWLWSRHFTSFTSLFPGAAGLGLAAVAVATRVAFRDARARMCLALGIVGFVLSFGPKAPGYAALFDMVPLLHAVRAPSRFGYLVIIGVALLAGFGAVELRRRLPARHWAPMASLLIVLAIVEPLAAPLYLAPFTGVPLIYDQLRDVPDALVVELPFPTSRAVFHNAKYMLNSTRHWKPMLNGYSGFVPGSYHEHFAQISSFPAAPAIEALRRLKVTHLFVHTEAFHPDVDIIQHLAREPALTEVARELPVVLYRLREIQ